MTVLFHLPFEIWSEILSFALQIHGVPGDVLCVNSSFCDIGTRILYSRLQFHTIRQLSLFSKTSYPPAYPPRTVEVTLAGGTADFDVFRYLAAAFKRCNSPSTHSGEPPASPLSLDLLSLCLNSHVSSPSLQYIYDALVSVSPKCFMWLGPDPGHHFSIAIVPEATYYMFRAISTWSDVEHITLTNVCFPSDQLGIHGPLAHNVPLLSGLPNLRTLYLGQGMLLPPSSIAAMIFYPGQETLEQIRLVDTYTGSIWGPRIRRTDVESAALSLHLDLEPETILERVRRLVRCEAKNERIMGGDRVEGLTLII